MELSEEEKKAIEYLENRLDILHNNTQWATEKSIKVVLNLVDKQQEEIKEKSTIIMAGAEKVKQLEEEIEELKIKQDNEKYFKQFKEELKPIIKGDYISKDKIREAIKNREIELYADNPENNFIPFDKVIDTLKELLEEN